MSLASTRRLKITRRGIQLSLGLLWLLDGVLQLQHQMFTASFANNVIAPVAQGQPIIVSGPIHSAVHILLMHPALFNTCFALIQLSLGALILWKRTSRSALITSVFWALLVWYLGEGLGGILSGHALLLMGAPGAAVIYGILAIGTLTLDDKKPTAKNDLKPAAGLAVVWAVLWVGGAIYQLLPGQNNVSDVSAMISSNVSGAPGWLASLDIHTANVIQGIGNQTASMSGMHMSANQMANMPTSQTSGYWFILLLASVQLLIGLAIFLSGRGRKIAVASGIVLSLVFWAVGQSFGAYYSGLATDPDSAPLFILLGIAITGSLPYDFKYCRAGLARLLNKVEKIIT
jgi:hypothetical protein